MLDNKIIKSLVIGIKTENSISFLIEKDKCTYEKLKK